MKKWIKKNWLALTGVLLTLFVGFYPGGFHAFGIALNNFLILSWLPITLFIIILLLVLILIVLLNKKDENKKSDLSS